MDGRARRCRMNKAAMQDGDTLRRERRSEVGMPAQELVTMYEFAGKWYAPQLARRRQQAVITECVEQGRVKGVRIDTLPGILQHIHAQRGQAIQGMVVRCPIDVRLEGVRFGLLR